MNQSILSTIGGVLLFALVLALELIDANGHIHIILENENYLEFDLFRSALIWLSGLLLAIGALTYPTSEGRSQSSCFSELKWGLLTASLGLFFCLILVFDPDQFTYLVQEDGIIENLSALLFFISWILCFAAAYKEFKHMKDWIRAGFLFAFGSAFWLIGMEEVSWFQRVLDIETPAIMASNWQGEMNLHNFSTTKAENIYYFGSFVFLVLLPAFRGMASSLPLIRQSVTIFPDKAVFFTAIIFTAYTSYMWTVAFIQLPFFFAFSWILLKLISGKSIQQRITYLYFAICLGGTQVVFLLHADDQIRSWDTTEYKELFIPVAFFVYALNQATTSYRGISKKCAAS